MQRSAWRKLLGAGSIWRWGCNSPGEKGTVSEIGLSVNLELVNLARLARYHDPGIWLSLSSQLPDDRCIHCYAQVLCGLIRTQTLLLLSVCCSDSEGPCLRHLISDLPCLLLLSSFTLFLSLLAPTGGVCVRLSPATPPGPSSPYPTSDLCFGHTVLLCSPPPHCSFLGVLWKLFSVLQDKGLLSFHSGISFCHPPHPILSRMILRSLWRCSWGTSHFRQ